MHSFFDLSHFIRYAKSFFSKIVCWFLFCISDPHIVAGRGKIFGPWTCMYTIKHLIQTKWNYFHSYMFQGHNLISRPLIVFEALEHVETNSYELLSHILLCIRVQGPNLHTIFFFCCRQHDVYHFQNVVSCWDSHNISVMYTLHKMEYISQCFSN